MHGTDVEMLSQITGLIRERLSVEVPGFDVDLIESGLLDSLALVTLITAVEETFACELPLEDFDIADFRSAERILAYMQSTGILQTTSS